MKKKIMIIEDDADVLAVLGDLLRTYGYEAHLFSAGENALAVIEEILPDVVIMDLMMPEMNGFDICKKIRSMNISRNIPMIAITGYDSADNRNRIFDAGIDDYLPKPFDVKELLKKISDLVMV
jgi:DNA-binding response OmpR family regulator